ncbi:MAG: PAS domain S-box protein [Caulobacteraceae bacterium]|nr:PAS domain S-box protein [Caulobacteraceae bacterium]
MRVLIGIGFAAAALLLRWALTFAYGSITGFMILLPGVILSAVAAGRVAGLTTLVAALFGGWIVVGPSGVGVGVTQGLGQIATFNFIAVGLFCIWVSATLRDVVMRLSQTDAALDEEERRFRDIADVAPVMLWSADALGRVYVNAEFRRFWGSRPMSGTDMKAWIAAIHPEDRDRVVQASTKALTRREPMEIEARYLRHDGQWRTLKTYCRPRSGDGSGFLGMVGANVDVTDARADAIALAESRARFELVADSIPNLAWMAEPDGAIYWYNKRWFDYTGTTLAQMEGWGWQSVHDPDLVDGVRTRFQKAVTDGSSWEDLFPLRRHDGAWRWFLSRAEPVRDATGRIVRWFGTNTDVTDRREAEIRLRESEERFRLMADTAPSPVWMTNAEAEVEFVNQALVEFYGRTREEMIGHVWKAAVHPEDLPLVAEAMEAARPKRLPYGFEVRFQRVDGAWRWMRIAVSPRMDADGRFLGYVGMSFDVTETREALDALRESEERFRSVADTAPVLIWVTHADRTRAFVNEAYVAFHGGTYEEALAADWRAAIHPDDQERIVRESVAGEASGKPFSLEARYRRHDGEWRWLKSFSRPRVCAEGAVIGFVGVAFDVTEAKQVEGDLKRLNELLEERVGAALAEKAKAEADLMHAQRMEAVGRLTGGVAHDFNNLLTVVIGALDMILKSPEDARRRTRLGEAALAAARRGERLTHQLLAFSRRQTLRPEPTDLNALILEGEPLLRRAVGEAVKLDLKLSEKPARVNVDPAQFEAALLNLVVNARDAVSEGGRIVIETRVRRLRAGQVAELGAGDHVCVAVSDDGAGIDPEILPRIFEPFFTTKAVGKGTGLGLSQVYGFSRQSGGGLDVESEPGAGTTIRMFLPAIRGAIRTPATGAQTSVATSRTGRRLLLVEDDVAVAAVAAEMIESLGFDVQVADHAAAALEALRSRAFDVMLTDVVMPGGMSGVDLARLTSRDWPQMSVVLASGYAAEEMDRVVADVPWPFVRKPYSRETLSEVLTAEPV